MPFENPLLFKVLPQKYTPGCINLHFIKTNKLKTKQTLEKRSQTLRPKQQKKKTHCCSSTKHKEKAI